VPRASLASPGKAGVLLLPEHPDLRKTASDFPDHGLSARVVDDDHFGAFGRRLPAHLFERPQEPRFPAVVNDDDRGARRHGRRLRSTERADAMIADDAA
jgi:hypothetical protein